MLLQLAVPWKSHGISRGNRKLDFENLILRKVSLWPGSMHKALPAEFSDASDLLDDPSAAKPLQNGAA